jgi:hypothetical protein
MFPSRPLISLMLASSLLLVLPRGWCCIFAALGAKVTPAKGCCCHPEGPADPAVPPQPRPVKYCPCAERNTVAPEHPELPSADVLLCVGMTDLPPPRPLVLALDRPRSSWLAHPPPLHLLHCAWLC